MPNTKPAGKYAYTAVVVATGYIIGRADYGTRGYTPFPKAGSFRTYDEAKAAAKELNAGLGLTESGAFEIVCDTMR